MANNWFLVPFATLIALVCFTCLFLGFVVLDEIRFSATWWRLQLAYPIFLHTIGIFSVTGLALFFSGYERKWINWSVAIVIALNILPIVHQLSGLSEGETGSVKNTIVESYSGTKYSGSTSKNAYKIVPLSPQGINLSMPQKDWRIAWNDCGGSQPKFMAGLTSKDRIVSWRCTTDAGWRDATMVAACEPDCVK